MALASALFPASSKHLTFKLYVPVVNPSNIYVSFCPTI